MNYKKKKKLDNEQATWPTGEDFFCQWSLGVLQQQRLKIPCVQKHFRMRHNKKNRRPSDSYEYFNLYFFNQGTLVSKCFIKAKKKTSLY